MNAKKKPAIAEFYTAKRIDNSRLVHTVEPIRLRGLYRMAGMGAIIAAFFMMYIYQHFKCIDLSFQLEDLKAQQMQASGLNSELRLEIEGLRDPRRIDAIAKQQLGLKEPLPTQMQEFDAYSASRSNAASGDAQVASVRDIRPDPVQ